MRSASEITAELLTTGLDQRQLTLLAELLAVSSDSRTMSADMSADSAEARLTRRREADRKYRRDKRNRDKQTMIAVASLSSDSRTTQSTGAIGDSTITTSTSTKKEASGKGVRLGDGEGIREAARAYADEQGLRDFDRHWAEFVDYWMGIPAQRGLKTAEKGWPATWRNRVRALLERQATSNGRHPPARRMSGPAELALREAGLFDAEERR